MEMEDRERRRVLAEDNRLTKIKEQEMRREELEVPARLLRCRRRAVRGCHQFGDVIELPENIVEENIVEEGSLVGRVRVLDTLGGFASREGGLVRKWKEIVEKECRGMILTSADLAADEADQYDEGYEEAWRNFAREKQYIDAREMEMKRKERELRERVAKCVRKEKECLERESVRELEGQHRHKGKGRVRLHQGFQGVVFLARQE
ncbi:hypothetical protein TrCOL_g7020 [Triparma columacea]|uniref:Uncharacterized protein n=1 Tax=Triparma columacea TaxID=722753 RepID=A0A9W7G7X3_9STRA|nr:hypothetical protein TrCOL_g7020 [Triparma columacea]